MGKSSRVRLSDLKQVYRIINEIVELGNDPQLWRPHLTKQLHRLLDLQLSHVYVIRLPLMTANAGVTNMNHHGLDDAADRLWMEYGNRGDLSGDPCTPAIVRRAAAPFTATRHRLVDDQTWYNSAYFNEFRRQVRSDDLLVSLVPIPEFGILHGMGGDRPKGAAAIGRREVVCTGLVHQDLARRWQKLLVKSAAVERSLPPRLAELLQHLRGLESEKQIALQMGISPHTVHNHVRRLYSKFNVTSRSELMMMDSTQRPSDIPRVGIAGI
jgi:DNA-binding CsgD family transcriptional regulator